MEDADSLLGDDDDKEVPSVFWESDSPEWNDWQKVICADDEGRVWYQNGSAKLWWQENLYPKTQKGLRLAAKEAAKQEKAKAKEAANEEKAKQKKRKTDSPIPEELPERWLRSHSDALKIGAERVLLFEGKWLAKMDVEDVKAQVVSYACAITRS